MGQSEGFARTSGTLARVVGRLGSAGTVDQSTSACSLHMAVSGQSDFLHEGSGLSQRILQEIQDKVTGLII